MAQRADIVLYHYTFSPYAKRVVWYLNLRGIEYAQCLQPPIMPRPDLDALGVQYRRIPVMTIGKDIYCDSRLILQKLEERFPEGALGLQDPDGKALEKLLEIWTTDGGVFARVAQLIPPDTPLTADPKFIKDRENMTGKSWKRGSILKGRAEATVHVKQAFELLETTLLADGRKWLLKTKMPTLADIHALWPLDWANGMKGALDHDAISEHHYPNVFAWMYRFKETLSEARAASPKPMTLSSEEALLRFKSAEFSQPEGEVEATDSLKLQKGQEVMVWPTDSGSEYRDSGQLLTLNAQEVVVQRKALDNQTDVRIHWPRTNFRIVPVDGVLESRL